MLAQLLRVYKQVFDLSYFELEPSQYGEGSPEGIKTGAFWFYYKLGFRPQDKKLRRLADLEWKKINSKNNYRSSYKTLTKFTESNMELSFSEEVTLSASEISEIITAMFAEKFSNDRAKGVKVSVGNFIQKAGKPGKLTEDQRNVLTDISLVVEALKIKSPQKIEFLMELIKVKPKDLYRTQELWRRIF
ncbi:MAG: hypothetical protein HC811_12975 [Flammeovirgaceae bacterium]|nr:hypothetical protein [Flammeovirgaceae bacterium]